eukprot:gene10087-38724_t
MLDHPLPNPECDVTVLFESAANQPSATMHSTQYHVSLLTDVIHLLQRRARDITVVGYSAGATVVLGALPSIGAPGSKVSRVVLVSGIAPPEIDRMLRSTNPAQRQWPPVTYVYSMRDSMMEYGEYPQTIQLLHDLGAQLTVLQSTHPEPRRVRGPQCHSLAYHADNPEWTSCVVRAGAS